MHAGGVSCAVGESSFPGLRYGIEPLLEQYQVDMYFTGHIHMYVLPSPHFKPTVRPDSKLDRSS